MKKIILSIAVIAAMCASCTSTSQKAEAKADDFKAMIDTCTNADSMKVYIERAIAYAQQLQKEGKGEEAEMYLNDISSVVATKEPSMVTMFDVAKTGIDMKVTADSLAEVAKEKAKDAADSLKTAAAETVGNVKDAVSDKANEVKEAAAEKAGEAVDKAKEAAASATSAAKEKAAGALNSIRR